MASDELPVLTSQKAAITPFVGLEDGDKVLEDNLDDPTRLTRLGRATIAQVGAITPTPPKRHCDGSAMTRHHCHHG